MITTIKQIVSNALNDDKEPSLMEIIQKKQKENVLNVIAYVGEGNVKLQQKRILFEKDIETLKQSVLSYSFIENKNK